MAITLISTRYKVMKGSRRIGVVIPRDDHLGEWAFCNLLDPDHAWYFGSTPELAVAACPDIQEYLLSAANEQ